MAQEALRHLQPGGQILLIARDTAAFKNPATEAQLAGFRKTLRKARVNVGSIQWLQVDPLRPLEVPSGDFQEWIRKAPKGSVIVSFMGPPPLLSPVQRQQLGDHGPAIVAFCPGSVPERANLPALFEQGLLRTAVISRRNGGASSAAPKDLKGWFEREFVGITSADATALPARSDAALEGRTP
jgi:hypothetical protein